MTNPRPVPGNGTKMMFLIRRRPQASREELIAHWFANHMPDVIRRQELQASAGKPAASRYIATLFDPLPATDLPAEAKPAWDGVAQLWFPDALPKADPPHGTRPADSFQEKAEPYQSWATREYVVIDGELPVVPLTLNAPFPTTRSGFCKVTYLVTARPDTDYAALFDHWLDVHVPNVVNAMQKTGGFRYLVSHSIDPNAEPYAGMAELYFPDTDAVQAFLQVIEPDGINEYLQGLEMRTSGTEMVGIC